MKKEMVYDSKPLEKITVDVKTFKKFYLSICNKLLTYYSFEKISCKGTVIWTKIKRTPAGEIPYFIAFICKELRLSVRSDQINKAFRDKKGNFVYPLYMYNLNQEINEDILNIDIIKNRGDIFAQFLGYQDLQSFLYRGTLEQVGVETVKKFYEYIGQKNFEEAWEILSPDFRGRKPWLSVFSTFVELYRNFRGIKDIHFFGSKLGTNNRVECFVSFEEEIEINQIQELALLEALTVKSIDRLKEKISSIREMILQNSGDIKEFDIIPLYKFFDPAISEYIWVKCFPNNYEDFYNIFPTTRSIFVKRLYECVCLFPTEEICFIDRIIYRQVHSSR